jgi:hypothetical protein
MSGSSASDLKLCQDGLRCTLLLLGRIILKYPTAAGSPTATLLGSLSKRFPGAPGAKSNFLAVLRWLKTVQLDAGVIARPPERPALAHQAAQAETGGPMG